MNSSHCPPNLVGISETDFGSNLTLSDGTSVGIDVRPTRLDEVLQKQMLTEYGALTLNDLVRRQTVVVFVGHLLMTADRWHAISKCLRLSTAGADVFDRFPSLWAMLHEPYEGIAAMPHRVYGGLTQSVYTSHPVDFQSNPNRAAPWYRACLNHRGGWLITTWVNIDSGNVEIETEQHPGHFIE